MNPAGHDSRADVRASGRIGRLAVVLMVGLGAGLALFGILHQRSQTLRCLRFLGAAAARRVAASNHVELLRLRPGDREGRLVAVDRWDISAARGVVHLRRGLVEDANYEWLAPPADGSAAASGRERLPSSDWKWGIAFAGSARAVDADESTILAFAPGGSEGNRPGWMTLVGAAGRVRLGRIDKGLSTWIEGLLSATPPAEEREGLGRIGKEGERRP